MGQWVLHQVVCHPTAGLRGGEAAETLPHSWPQTAGDTRRWGWQDACSIRGGAGPSAQAIELVNS